MIAIDLSQYGPIIGNETVAQRIYDLILVEVQKGSVEINMYGVKLMATFCAKQIFGGLYNALGGELFYKRISIINATDNVKKTIGIGIEMSLTK